MRIEEEEEGEENEGEAKPCLVLMAKQAVPTSHHSRGSAAGFVSE